jgi:ATP-dependent 26S proteasome regulatory subunit
MSDPYDPYGHGRKFPPYPGVGGLPSMGPNSVDAMMHEIETLKARLSELEDRGKIKSLSTVIAIDVFSVTVVMQGALYEIPLPADDVDSDSGLEMRKIKKELVSKLHIGAVVKVYVPMGTNTAEIIGVMEAPMLLGPYATVKEVLVPQSKNRGGTLLVTINADTRTVIYYLAKKEPKPGDRLVLDFYGLVVQRNLGSHDMSHALTGNEEIVTWDDIGGQEEAKRVLQEAIVDPVAKKKIYEHFGSKPSKGVLLFGASGTGKTMLAKAAVTALAKLYGKESCSSGFIYVKGPELLSKWLGETEANIRRLFASAREHKTKYGYPAILFIDESDALLGRRGSMGPGYEGMERTLVPQFLAEMDGMTSSGAFVLLATNRPDILDPAVVRDGRIDRKVHVSRPTEKDAASIFDRLLKDKHPVIGMTGSDCARALFAPNRVLWHVKLKDQSPKNQDAAPDGKARWYQKDFTLGHLASGAMIAGVVQRAVQRAIRVESEHIELGHIVSSIDEVEEEQSRLALDASEFMEGLIGQEMLSVEKAKRREA